MILRLNSGAQETHRATRISVDVGIRSKHAVDEGYYLWAQGCKQEVKPP